MEGNVLRDPHAIPDNVKLTEERDVNNVVAAAAASLTQAS